MLRDQSRGGAELRAALCVSDRDERVPVVIMSVVIMTIGEQAAQSACTHLVARLFASSPKTRAQRVSGMSLRLSLSSCHGFCRIRI